MTFSDRLTILAGTFAGWFHKVRPNTWSLFNMPSTSTPSTEARAEKITVVQAALRAFIDSHAGFAAHMVTDEMVNEAATVAVDAGAQYDAGKVI